MNSFIFTINILYLVIMMVLVSLNIKYGDKSPIYKIAGIIILSILTITALSYALINTSIMSL